MRKLLVLLQQSRLLIGTGLVFIYTINYKVIVSKNQTFGRTYFSYLSKNIVFSMANETRTSRETEKITLTESTGFSLEPSYTSTANMTNSSEFTLDYTE
jgi:hypothetical protein